MGGRAQLQRALKYRAEIDAGEIESQAALARREKLTRARITQVMTLLKLAPEIQDRVLALPPEAFGERQLRRIALMPEPAAQRAAFARLAPGAAAAPTPAGSPRPGPCRRPA